MYPKACVLWVDLMRCFGTMLRDRSGFSLLEMVVVMALIAILATVVVPAVIAQTAKGEAARVLSDLEAVTTGVKVYRVETSRWPSSITHLVQRPLATDMDLDSTALNQGLVDRWNGSYLEQPVPGPRATGFAGKIRDAFTKTDDGFLALEIESLAEDHQRQIDRVIDGAVNAASGRVTYGAGVLTYRAVSLHNGR